MHGSHGYHYCLRTLSQMCNILQKSKQIEKVVYWSCMSEKYKEEMELNKDFKFKYVRKISLNNVKTRINREIIHRASIFPTKFFNNLLTRSEKVSTSRTDIRTATVR